MLCFPASRGVLLAQFQFGTATSTLSKKPATLPPPIRYSKNREKYQGARDDSAGVFILSSIEHVIPTGAIARESDRQNGGLCCLTDFRPKPFNWTTLAVTGCRINILKAGRTVCTVTGAHKAFRKTTLSVSPFRRRLCLPGRCVYQ